MCGIVVVLGEDDSFQDLFRKSNKRGPEGTYSSSPDPDVFMGFHRLAINGLDNESNQPLEHNERYFLVCNGEIFNYRQLSTQHQLELRTHSDCEVILHLYERYKEKVTDYLDGEFAFVIYDRIERTVFVARDHYGVRPLYVSRCNQGTVRFSSDLVMVKDMDVVEQLTPGNSYLYQKQGATWSIVDNKCFLHRTCRATEKHHVLNALCEAVKKRVVDTTERPVACLLSGGLDSSLVAALAMRYTTVETYSIGLPGSEDLKYSQMVADHIGSKHTQIVCSVEEFIQAIPHVIRDVESYDTTTVRASVGNWLVGKYIAEHSDAKVILNGDGADELMGGYLYMHACPSAEEFDRECVRLLSNIQYFDVLRSDKSISSHGLEPRTPYLDKYFVDAYLNLPADLRYHPGHKRCEKYIIRDLIKERFPDLLPLQVLYRKKEAFSDGVSSLQKSWYQIIQENLVDDDQPTKELTKEQQYYRRVFDQVYGEHCRNLIPYAWMPKYVNATDASARTLSLYQQTCPS
jgi:asparagine synthase (glutamine-hydrolysing)